MSRDKGSRDQLLVDHFWPSLLTSDADYCRMSDFTTVAKVGSIEPGRGEAFAVNGRMVAVFNVDGQYRAMDDTCPHMGASLSGGDVANGIVTCPWHAWRFRVCDGAWYDNPKGIVLDTFQVRVVGDEIQVRVPPR